MREKTLTFLGLMRRANALQVGETNAGAAVRGGKARLLLLASDASDNARRRAEGFVHGRHVPLVPLPFSKEELSDSLGLSGCSMAAVTDMGFARALAAQLCALDAERYAALAEETGQRFDRLERRKQEAAAHERNKRTGKRRTNG